MMSKSPDVSFCILQRTLIISFFLTKFQVNVGKSNGIWKRRTEVSGEYTDSFVFFRTHKSRGLAEPP